MFKIVFYKDRHGNSQVREYILSLMKRNDKDSRLRLNKINNYITYLKNMGKAAGKPYVKRIEGDIWEMRPLDDRIFFVVWRSDSIIFLHQFRKKSQKTPRSEIERARREYADLSKRGIEDDG